MPAAAAAETRRN